VVFSSMCLCYLLINLMHTSHSISSSGLLKAIPIVSPSSMPISVQFLLYSRPHSPSVVILVLLQNRGWHNYERNYTGLCPFPLHSIFSVLFHIVTSMFQLSS
jgi:hypothetical protein